VDWSLRARLRSAICASAVATRARASLSSRRINGSPANTLSLTPTSTSPIRPTTAAAILISPDQGSTRPGATACQPRSSGGSGGRTPSWARICAAIATTATMPSTAIRPVFILFDAIKFFDATGNPTTASLL